MLEFHLLGPLELSVSGARHPVQGVTQKVLLLALLLSANHKVQADTLRYELWGESWSDSPDNALHAHVSRLRRRLERAEPERDTPRLVADRTGYQLLVEDDEIDGRRFHATLTTLRQQRAVLSPQALVCALREALSSWHGPVFGGVLGGPICSIAGRGFEEDRQEALEMLFDAELRRGNHTLVVAELGPLLTKYSPLLESFTEQMMIALYRSGRQVEALQVYRHTVGLLLTHGDQPGVRLKRCELAILNQHPALDRATADHAA
ncbi:DNA-binding SARP family transcriptional activator [Kitasatospora sp. MAA4]|uniref:AfsR/SARP family transcriptional regulator n=1 Tax=Kitasatospora sp. MAA4 TaxID=3035093 RepID=UPI002473706D|nr:AfsR/SARP family transcriptional regulator [Kitasatospora sp. MAA4]MDH6135478.1 DNA-binding SARP family transcriptional activator [Kitasatospora sp. MAA4]